MSETFTTYKTKIEAQEEIVRKETEKLYELHRERPEEKVKDYTFKTTSGTVQLSELFGDKKELILIHNMGERCPYCTLWADGFVGFKNHFEDRAAFVLINNDSHEKQSEFANSRGWNFKIASAEGTSFSTDLGFYDPEKKEWNAGTSIFVKNDDGSISHKTSASFGPGDIFCSLWSFFEILPGGVGKWDPKKSYPQKETFRFSRNIALNVKNIDQAVSFYRDTLGFSMATAPTDHECGGAPLRKGGMTFWMDPTKEQEKVGQAFFEFIVTDLESCVQLLKGKGCEIVQSTQGGDFQGRMMSDPFGMKFHLYQPKSLA
jgi:predicted dithiol-disulfide oxidoreductase (DUF899 family)/uncharacterized glyoxalase superfamily protein PhnB